MKKIFEGKIYEVLPKSDGIVFPYQKAVVDEGDIVWYKMLSIENSNMTDISKNIYWNLKFGSNYAVAVNTAKNFVETKALLLPNGRLLATSTARAIDSVRPISKPSPVKRPIFIIRRDGEC